MKRLNGWQRIWVVLSGLGLLALALAIYLTYNHAGPRTDLISEVNDPVCVNFPLLMRSKDIPDGETVRDELTKPRTQRHWVEVTDAGIWMVAISENVEESHARLIIDRAMPTAVKQKDFKRSAIVIPGWMVLLDPPNNFGDKDALSIATKLSGNSPDISGRCGSLLWFWYFHAAPVLTEQEYREWASSYRRRETLEVTGISLAVWAGLSVMTYALGWLIAWIIRGFRKTP